MNRMCYLPGLSSFLSLWTLLSILLHQHNVNASGGSSGHDVDLYPDLYSYFETPLKDDIGPIGPSRWRDLEHIANNQCGGGFSSSFQQSPIIFPQDVISSNTCHTDMDGYDLKQGDCTWDDLEFKVTKHGLSVKAKNKHAHHGDGHINHEDHDEPLCYLGFATIPQSNQVVYKATELKVKLGSEHGLERSYHDFEFQIFHQEELEETKTETRALTEATTSTRSGDSDSSGKTQAHTQRTTQAAFALLVRLNLEIEENEMLELLLNKWNTHAWKTEDRCADAANQRDTTTKEFNIDSVFKAKQKLILCPAPGTYAELDLGNDLPRGITNDQQPPATDLFPNVYTYFGNSIDKVFTYDGSLTHPPCTENVHWNLFDDTFSISYRQHVNLVMLITCFTDVETCQLASAASEFGKTSRPPQDLNQREIVIRCDEGPYEANWMPSSTSDLPKVAKYAKEKIPQPYYAMLFPWFITFLGLVVFYIMTRTFHAIPYTAIIFLIGVIMGIVVSNDTRSHDQLTTSTFMWDNINGELLLISFLPGLLFKDAYGLDTHLFRRSLGQTMLMAFPMVLAGTSLLALVAYYILPYDWSFNFCMTFGAILSATDPVAVSALLNELGAPPRLKTHIAGESLLNDGSAIVFYSIFKTLFLNELGLISETIDLGSGIVKFINMALGAASVGIGSGIVLCLFLFLLNRRFNEEESIVQVTATICFAYLTFYVAEVPLKMSGVIAVVCCGVTAKAFGSPLIIDQEMMSKFWNLVEHLLNSVLFALGGLVWGSVISNMDETRPETFSGSDWGYLILVYILMNVIRLCLFAAFFPIISKIGLGSNWKEMVFQSFGGLRGAVGIALAIALDSEVIHETVRTDPRRIFTSQLFGITGGISLFTLFINGTLSGPLLRKLSLNRSSKEREDIVRRYDQHVKEYMLIQMMKELGRKQYEHLDFDIIQHHVPQLSNVTFTDLKIAIRQVKDTTPTYLYDEPQLLLFKPFLLEEEYASIERMAKLNLHEKIKGSISLITRKTTTVGDDEDDGNIDQHDESHQRKLRELRLVFVELLRNGYRTAMEDGLINVREGVVEFLLRKSVAIAEDDASNGKAIDDWKYCHGYNSRFSNNLSHTLILASAFIRIHSEAQQVFKFKFCQSSTLSQTEQQILSESREQMAHAEKVFDTTDVRLIKRFMSLKLSSDLINQAALFIDGYVKRGLLKPEEGEHYSEHFGHSVSQIMKHPDYKNVKDARSDDDNDNEDQVEKEDEGQV